MTYEPIPPPRPKRWQLDRREVVSFALADDTPPVLRRLHCELTWYHRSALRKKRAYRVVKSVEFILAALVPLGAGLDWSVATIGLLGVVIVVCQGFQQLFQLHAQWLAHRATYEALRREESLYFAKAGPYKGSEDPEALLAERVEKLRAIETNQWVETEMAEKQNETGTGAARAGAQA
jgi:hypothetical protein